MGGKMELVEVHEVLGYSYQHVECPTCGAFPGWACGEDHVSGSHRARVLLALRRAGREVRVHRKYPAPMDFYQDLRDWSYWDRVPGYRGTYVRRLRSRDL
jgi:hypothetical protein